MLFFFFFNDTATTEIYTLSLHDALPILPAKEISGFPAPQFPVPPQETQPLQILKSLLDRKSTRLNSSHLVISYAVFCLKKKKKTIHTPQLTISHHITLSLPVHVPIL